MLRIYGLADVLAAAKTNATVAAAQAVFDAMAVAHQRRLAVWAYCDARGMSAAPHDPAPIEAQTAEPELTAQDIWNRFNRKPGTRGND